MFDISFNYNRMFLMGLIYFFKAIIFLLVIFSGLAVAPKEVDFVW
jgi:hypothetical protein